MDTFFPTYSSAIAALGGLGALMLVQLLISDVLGIVKKHVPGTPVEANHGSTLFRVSRAVANTNESVAVFICALLYCTLGYANPLYTAYLAWAFVFARALYALCYYANLQTFRSICFGVSLLILLGMLVVGATTSLA